MLKPIDFKASDISPIVLWLGTTVYGVIVYVRSERAKKLEIKRQEAQDARQSALDTRDLVKEEKTEETVRGDRWKADSESWEKKARASFSEAETLSQRCAKLQEELDEKNLAWSGLDTTYHRVLQEERERFEARGKKDAENKIEQKNR